MSQPWEASLATLEQELAAFWARRKTEVAKIVAQGGEKKAALLKKYGAPGMLEAAGQGFVQGAAHGMADDAERGLRKDGTAVSQIRAQAAHPFVHGLSSLAGTMATSVGLRGLSGRIGKLRSAGARASAKGGTAGSGAWSERNAERAREIEEGWESWNGMKPQHRGLLMDVGHGAAWGYGGSDVTEDEGLFDGERLARMGAGGLLSGITAPFAASATVAAGNAPLAFGRRRAFSKKMLEPPGVTAQNPRGRPRDAIEIAREMDEAAARNAGKKGALVRDRAAPLDSQREHVRRVADRALVPVAKQRIGELKGAEREAAARAMETAHPGPGGRAPDATTKERMFTTPNGKTYLVEFVPSLYTRPDGAGRGTEVMFREAPASRQQSFWRKLGMKAKGVFLGDPDKGGDPYMETWDNSGPEAMQVLRGVRNAIGEDVAAGGRPRYEMVGNTPQKNRIYGRMAASAAPDGYTVKVGPSGTAMDRKPDEIGEYVSAMLEPFVRRDGAAVAAWSKSLKDAAAKDPAVMERMRNAVVKQLAMTERASPAQNDDAVVTAYLRALGLAGGKGGRQVLKAARGPAAKQFPTKRFEDALAREGEGMQVRPRHAASLREEMGTYAPGQYTAPHAAVRGQPLTARGDDKAYWLNPFNFFKDGAVNNSEVSMAGFLSGPAAWLGERGVDVPGVGNVGVGSGARFLFGDPEDDSVIDAEFEEAPPEGLFSEPAPRAAPAPAQRALPAPPAQQAAMPQAGGGIEELQGLLLSAGLDVGDQGADGVVGARTAAALLAAAEVTGMPGRERLTPEAIIADPALQAALLKRMRAYPRERLAEDISARLGGQ